MSYYPDLQFLDLDDVSEEEKEDIHRILYISRTPRSVALPWVEQHVDWNLQSNYEGETSECSESGSECYPRHPVPVSTSLHQVYPPHATQVVPAVQFSYIPQTATPYYPQQPPQPPHQVYEGGRRRNKTSPKRSSTSGTGGNPSTPTATVPPAGASSVAPPSAYAPHQLAYHLVAGVPPGQYHQFAVPAAQHATGHPLFLTPQMPGQIFTTAPHIYPHQYTPSHQQVFSAGIHSGGGGGLGAGAQDRSPKGDEGGVVRSSTPSGSATSHIHHQPPTTLSTPHHQPSPDVDVGLGQEQGGLHMVMQSSGAALGPPQGITVPQEPHPEEHLPHIASVPTTPANTDTDLKAGEVQEGVGGTRVLASKSHPPLNAIKTTSLPSGGIKSNPVKPTSLPLPTSQPVAAPREVEDNQPPSPTTIVPNPPLVAAIPSTPVVVVPLATPLTPTVGPIALGGVQPQVGVGGAQPLASLPPQSATIPPPPAVVAPVIPVAGLPCSALTGTPTVLSASPIQVNQPKQKGTWAGLFKTNESPQSMPSSTYHVQSPIVQPPLHNSIPAHSPETFQSGSGKVSVKPGPLSKGPPQNSMVVQPPPLLSSSNYHTNLNTTQHHNTSANPQPQHQTSNDSKSTSAPPSKLPHSPPGHSVAFTQDPALNRIADLLSEYELENRAVVLTPRGLNNPSNYCYINATLQALLACAPFYNLVSALAKHKPYTTGYSSNSSTKSATPVIDSMIQFVSEFSVAPANRLRKERSEKAQARKEGGGVDQDPGFIPGPSFEPSYVYRMVHNSFSLLQLEDRQEDAEEFLTVLLNGLNDEMIELLKLKGIGLSNGEVTTNGDSHADMDNSDWKEVMNKGTSRVTRRTEVGRTPVTDIFMGQIRSRVERSDPHLSTDNIQPFFSLHLDVESCNTVDEALAKMTNEKAVEGGQSGEETTTASYIDQYPLVLILHLKCFHYSHGRLTKIAKSLDFPIDLRIGSKLMQTNKPKHYAKGTAYKLFAVVYHEGKEATKGHYLADVYHVGSSCWIRYDDAQVKSVSEQQVLKPKPPRVPYLLLYRRIDKPSRS